MSEVQISDALRNIEAQILRAATLAHDDYTDLLAEDVRAEIRRDGSVRTGRYVNTVRARAAIPAGGLRIKTVESDVGYSLFPELGRRPNPSGRGGFVGKFSQLHAIQKHAGRRVNDAFGTRLREIGAGQ